MTEKCWQDKKYLKINQIFEKKQKNQQKYNEKNKNNENLVFEMIENPVQPPQETPSATTPPAQRPNNATVDVTGLLCQLYTETRIVDMIIQQLTDISPRFANNLSEINLKNKENQSIYYDLYFEAARATVPRERLVMPILGSNFCEGLQVLDNLINEMIVKNKTIKDLGLTNFKTNLETTENNLLIQKTLIEELQNNC